MMRSMRLATSRQARTPRPGEPAPGLRLTTRIILLCAAAVLPSLAMQAWHELSLRDTRREEVRAEARRFALQSAAELERVVDGAEQLLRAVAITAMHHGDEEPCSAELAELRRTIGRYAGLAYAAPDGRVLCSSAGPQEAGTPLRSIADRPYLQRALASGERQLGEFTVGRGSGQPTLPVAVPIGEPGAIRVVAIAALDLDWLSANLAGNIALPPGGSVTVADRDGVILARTPLPDRFVGTRIPDTFRHLLAASEPGAIEVLSQDGTSRVLGYVPLRERPQGLYVSAGFSTEAAYAAMGRSAWRAGLLILVSFLSALGAAWLFGRLILRRPLDRLLGIMRRWGEGDLAARAAIRDGWEIGRLAAGFNAMAEAVGAREQALAASEARLRALLDQLPVGIVLAEVPGGRVLFRNARAADLLQDGGETRTTLPLLDPLQQAVREGRATDDLELPLRRADGSETVISVTAAPVAGLGGQPLAVAAFLDVGARRHAERQQALLTAELRHRVKNALAVVQAVAAQTAAASPSIEVFKTSFSARLRDLARAQDAIFAAADGRVRLDWLVATALAPFAPGQVSLTGPELPLPAKQTLAMALVLHEMATNAAKHGAMRPGAGGRLVVQWELRPGEAGEDLVLAWRETSPGAVPPPPAPGRGFGARLIARCVAHDLRGEAAWQIEGDSLVWRLRLPAPLAESLEAPAAELA
jgi:two-component sensor histidine kinase